MRATNIEELREALKRINAGGIDTENTSHADLETVVRFAEEMLADLPATKEPPVERDMSPEEALAEARKRWGKSARVGGDCWVGYNAPYGEKAGYWSDSTFKAAFASADREADKDKGEK